MELGLELLMMRYALVSGPEFCKDRACFKSEDDALDAIAERKEPEKLTAWPCPYCEGGLLTLPDGKTSSLKQHGWHTGPVPSVSIMEEAVEMTIEECLKYDYPVGNESLKNHINHCDTECIFLHRNYSDIADPKTRRIYEVAQKAYAVLCEHLGCEW
jgi:hypothetical protein